MTDITPLTHHDDLHPVPQMLVEVIAVMNIPFTIMAKPWQTASLGKQSCWEWTQHEMKVAVNNITNFLHDVDLRFSPFKSHSLVSSAQRGEWSSLLDDQDFQEIYGKAALAKTLTHTAFDAFHQGIYDPIGLVKGWAIETALDRFLRPLLLTSFPHSDHHDSQSACCEAVAINGGGDIRVAVSQHSDYLWKIGIENPNNTSEIIAQCAIHNGGIATSGFNKRGTHITHTNEDEVLRQLTVISDSVEDADMWATAGIAAGLHSWKTLAQEHSLNAIAVRNSGEVLHFVHGEQSNNQFTSIVSQDAVELNTKVSKEPSC